MDAPAPRPSRDGPLAGGVRGHGPPCRDAHGLHGPRSSGSPAGTGPATRLAGLSGSRPWRATLPCGGHDLDTGPCRVQESGGVADDGLASDRWQGRWEAQVGCC